MIKDRIFSALILLLIFLVSYTSKNPIYFLLLSFAAGGILFYELAKILKLKSLALVIYWILSVSPVIFFYILVSLNILFPDGSASYLNNLLVNFSIFMSLISLVFWLVLAPIDIMYKKISSNIKFKIFYGYFIVVPMVIVTTNIFIQSKTLLLIPFAMIWISDIGAYFVGKKYGRNKLAKNISPGKTIEGAFGGFICNIIFAFVLVYLYELDLLIMFLFAIFISGLSILGDIYQSLLKRQAKVKDSGSIIPGHGGLFDRLDSFCPTLPISYLLYILIYGSVAPTPIL
jgi:phosphatidate cytidylyltransferase